MQLPNIQLNRTTLFVGGAIIGFIILALIFYLVVNSGVFSDRESSEPVTLQFWGVFDSQQYYEDAINKFKTLRPNVNIVYKQINYENYQQELINSFAAGTGPDIFLMHHSWLPKYKNLIQPLPLPQTEEEKPLMTVNDFKTQFVDVAANDLIDGDRIYAMPLYVDNLGLYYNRDIFNGAGISSPPKTYEDFNSVVGQLTKLDFNGNIEKSGAAIGTAQNINRSTDILMMLMLQSGVKMNEDDTTRADFTGGNNRNATQTALQYYTDFANPQKQVYTWNPQQQYSIDAFINGNTAMMFNYSHHIKTIRDKSARFNFSVAPVPQISNAQFGVTYASYWAPTVAKSSRAGKAAWEFLTFLGSPTGAASYINLSGRPSARRDFIEQQRSDPDLGPFAVQALSARSWKQIDNVAIEKIFAKMIEDINFDRADFDEALRKAENDINLISRQGGF